MNFIHIIGNKEESLRYFSQTLSSPLILSNELTNHFNNIAIEINIICTGRFDNL